MYRNELGSFLLNFVCKCCGVISLMWKHLWAWKAINFFAYLRCLGMWQLEWCWVPTKVCAGAVLALAVLVVSLLAEGNSQRGEVKYYAGTQDSWVFNCAIDSLLVLEKIILSLCFISLIAQTLSDITYCQLCQNLPFIPETSWSRCSVWFCILHHNKSSVLVGWATVPQLVVTIIILSRWYYGWTLLRFYFSALKTH